MLLEPANAWEKDPKTHQKTSSSVPTTGTPTRKVNLYRAFVSAIAPKQTALVCSSAIDSTANGDGFRLETSTHTNSQKATTPNLLAVVEDHPLRVVRAAVVHTEV